jgi:hypothetical protein
MVVFSKKPPFNWAGNFTCENTRTRSGASAVNSRHIFG